MSAEAERIEALVNKAATTIETKGKMALSEFRVRGSEWWSGDVYVFAYAPDGTVLLNPAFLLTRGARVPRRERQEREGVSRRGYEDRTNEGIRMGRLLVTQTWTD